MLIKIPKKSEIKECDVTDERIYVRRRDFMKTGLAATAALAVPSCGYTEPPAVSAKKVIVPRGKKLTGYKKTSIGKDLKLTAYKHVTGYNNFYEFGTAKSDPAKHAHTLNSSPWTVAIEGEVAKPGNYQLEDLLKKMPLEERIYRLRCVEAWSMVVPWIGFQLSALLKMVEPTSKAKFVEFVTLQDTQQMPGQNYRVLQWPYTEGLRIDEAMNSLTLMAVGVYGEEMPKQNGAPIRLVVPWKYGFKNVKSIVKIRLVEKAPATSWNIAANKEYGFYANVNPAVSHPRWTQARERIIGSYRRRKTEMFNGYSEQVASLYSGMDLRKYF
ncbi:Protein-methionine-sulfoxide reductase catalytic subunit MsrP [hydrothermal vent metagenome]|uniref:Protein-methionine-sulfoxide reductase catalytic subunit MsrP n=1 Tax=hydrothermal vent metagenome TaxID=652676 RepID=A0A3B0Z050_9ZZZZ